MKITHHIISVNHEEVVYKTRRRWQITRVQGVPSAISRQFLDREKWNECEKGIRLQKQQTVPHYTIIFIIIPSSNIFTVFMIVHFVLYHLICSVPIPCLTSSDYPFPAILPYLSRVLLYMLSTDNAIATLHIMEGSAFKWIKYVTILIGLHHVYFLTKSQVEIL